jgi:polysaccharide biosynthesis/export protein
MSYLALLLRPFAFVLVAVFALLVSGCSIMPVDGPQTLDVFRKADTTIQTPTDFRYELIKLSPEAAALCARMNRVVFSPELLDRSPPREIVIGEGDVVSVTIFESSAGGLFIPLEAGSRAGNFVTVPPQTVDRAGNIYVPYAGGVKAIGRTPARVQAEIQSKLAGRAIEPQAVVSVTEQRSQLVSVLGEVNNPNRFVVTAQGERLLDTISRAGGPRGTGTNLWVRLVRDGKRHLIHFSKLVNEPRNNIFTQPYDVIYVFSDPPTFLAFGATGQQGQVPFDVDHLSMAEAVAKSGGLLDAQADPRAVFLYRLETRELAKALGVDVSKYTENLIPIIYQVDLRDPKGFFAASQLQMANKDILYVANAGSVEIAKVLQFVRIGVAAVRETNALNVELP